MCCQMERSTPGSSTKIRVHLTQYTVQFHLLNLPGVKSFPCGYKILKLLIILFSEDNSVGLGAFSFLSEDISAKKLLELLKIRENILTKIFHDQTGMILVKCDTLSIFVFLTNSFFQIVFQQLLLY
jgi:hypothetical protein